MINKRIPKDIEEAMKAREKFIPEALKDTSRPQYHFVSPANLLIDVWGGIYHNGEYHLLYDNDYDNDETRQGGAIGHIRSKNLVEWEELPFALVPEKEKGEKQINDGTVVIDPSGRPLMFYTRCFFDNEKNREHVACYGSDDMLIWERAQNGEAVLTMENHGGPTFHMSWSDVIIFQESGRTFMIISKCVIPGKGEMIPIYEAVDDSWLKWKYRGVFAEHTGEVLNFIKIRDKWVLIYSPYQNPIYFVGDFDINTYKFTAEKTGILSYGYIKQGFKTDISRGFYATSVFYGENSTPYIMGWISGFINPKGWSGCASLARTLELDEDNNLLMKPVPQLEMLRTEKVDIVNNRAVCGRCFELELVVGLDNNGSVEISIEDGFILKIAENKICFNDIEFEYKCDEKIQIKMYIDVTVAEIFFDNGKISISRCFPEISEDAEIYVKGSGIIKECSLYKIQA